MRHWSDTFVSDIVGLRVGDILVYFTAKFKMVKASVLYGKYTNFCQPSPRAFLLDDVYKPAYMKDN